MATIKCKVQRSTWYEVYFEYSYTQDKTAATTSLTHALKLKQITDSYDFDTVGEVTVSYVVSGKTFSKKRRININDKGNSGYTITLASGSSTITHNDSTGVGSFTVSVDTSIESGGYGPGTIKLASQSVSLPTIYRASVPNANDARMGENLVIYTNSNSSAFTHTLKYTFGDATATIATGVGESYTWKVPDLASKCNNALSGTVTITCVTYNGSSAIGTETCEAMLYVPKASTPSFSSNSVVMGNSVTVYTNRDSTNFTHTLEFVFADKTVSTIKNVGKSTTFTPSLDLAKDIPNDTSGKVTVKCTTYNGTAKLSTVSVEFEATVPDNETTKPTASWTLAPSGSLPPAFSGLYIKGKTGVTATFTLSSNYSTIDSHKLTADGRNFLGNPATSSVFARDGNFTITGTVTDMRGFSRTLYEDITVHPYSEPSVEPASTSSAIICERYKNGAYNDAGPDLHIKCKRKYSPVKVDGVQKNFCSLQYQSRIAGEPWSEPLTLLDASDTSTGDYEVIIPDAVSQTDKTYTIKLIVKDAFEKENPYDFYVGTADVTMHLGEGGYGVAFGKRSEATPQKKMVELANDWSLVMGGNAVADFVVEQGVIEGVADGPVWAYRKWNSGRCELYTHHIAAKGMSTQSGNVYCSTPITAFLPFTVYDLTYVVDCGNSNVWASSARTDLAECNAIPYRIWSGSTHEETTWHTSIHVTGRWK